MGYVMVPVPEQLVPDVERFLRWNTVRVDPGVFDAESAERFLEAIHEPARRLVLVVAEAAVEARLLTTGAAAEAIDTSELEVIGIMTLLNGAILGYGKFPFGFIVHDQLAPSGQGEPVAYSLNMLGDVAEIMLAAARRRPTVTG